MATAATMRPSSAPAAGGGAVSSVPTEGSTTGSPPSARSGPPPPLSPEAFRAPKNQSQSPHNNNQHQNQQQEESITIYSEAETIKDYFRAVGEKLVVSPSGEQGRLANMLDVDEFPPTARCFATSAMIHCLKTGDSELQRNDQIGAATRASSGSCVDPVSIGQNGHAPRGGRLIMVGPPGAGKTRFAHKMCMEQPFNERPAIYLPLGYLISRSAYRYGTYMGRQFGPRVRSLPDALITFLQETGGVGSIDEANELVQILCAPDRPFPVVWVLDDVDMLLNRDADALRRFIPVDPEPELPVAAEQRKAASASRSQSRVQSFVQTMTSISAGTNRGGGAGVGAGVGAASLSRGASHEDIASTIGRQQAPSEGGGGGGGVGGLLAGAAAALSFSHRRPQDTGEDDDDEDGGGAAASTRVARTDVDGDKCAAAGRSFAQGVLGASQYCSATRGFDTFIFMGRDGFHREHFFSIFPETQVSEWRLFRWSEIQERNFCWQALGSERSNIVSLIDTIRAAFIVNPQLKYLRGCPVTTGILSHLVRRGAALSNVKSLSEAFEILLRACVSRGYIPNPRTTADHRRNAAFTPESINALIQRLAGIAMGLVNAQATHETFPLDDELKASPLFHNLVHSGLVAVIIDPRRRAHSMSKLSADPLESGGGMRGAGGGGLSSEAGGGASAGSGFGGGGGGGSLPERRPSAMSGWDNEAAFDRCRGAFRNRIVTELFAHLLLFQGSDDPKQWRLASLSWNRADRMLWALSASRVASRSAQGNPRETFAFHAATCFFRVYNDYRSVTGASEVHDVSENVRHRVNVIAFLAVELSNVLGGTLLMDEILKQHGFFLKPPSHLRWMVPLCGRFGATDTLRFLLGKIGARPKVDDMADLYCEAVMGGQPASFFHDLVALKIDTMFDMHAAANFGAVAPLVFAIDGKRRTNQATSPIFVRQLRGTLALAEQRHDSQIMAVLLGALPVADAMFQDHKEHGEALMAAMHARRRMWIHYARLCAMAPRLQIPWETAAGFVGATDTLLVQRFNSAAFQAAHTAAKTRASSSSAAATTRTTTTTTTTNQRQHQQQQQQSSNPAAPTSPSRPPKLYRSDFLSETTPEKVADFFTSRFTLVEGAPMVGKTTFGLAVCMVQPYPDHVCVYYDLRGLLAMYRAKQDAVAAEAAATAAAASGGGNNNHGNQQQLRPRELRTPTNSHAQRKYDLEMMRRQEELDRAGGVMAGGSGKATHTELPTSLDALWKLIGLPIDERAPIVWVLDNADRLPKEVDAAVERMLTDAALLFDEDAAETKQNAMDLTQRLAESYVSSPTLAQQQRASAGGFAGAASAVASSSPSSSSAASSPSSQSSPNRQSSSSSSQQQQQQQQQSSAKIRRRCRSRRMSCCRSLLLLPPPAAAPRSRRLCEPCSPPASRRCSTRWRTRRHRAPPPRTRRAARWRVWSADCR